MSNWSGNAISFVKNCWKRGMVRMNLDKLIEMQRVLDERIIKEKGLEGQDLVANTFVALQVELAEMANEGKWFKHWSNKQVPKMYPQEICSYCDEEVDYIRPTPFMADIPASMCKNCWTMTKEEYAASNGEYIPEFDDYPHFPKKVPQKLLEEFVDAVHFFLSIAIQKGWEDTLWIYEEQVDPDDYSGDLTGYYLEMTYFLNCSYIRQYSVEENERCKNNFGFQKNQYDFRTAWILFLNIGFNGFGFTWEKIFEAYLDKNKVNHERQANGY